MADCSTLVLCEDFEDGRVGFAPDAMRWQIGGPNCFSGAGQATIDDTQSWRGGKSVRLNPGGDYCGHVFIQTPTIDSLGPVRYVRFHVRLARALDNTHVTLVSLRDANDSGPTQSQELRLGGQVGVLKWNRSRDDATVPVLSPQGVALSVPLPAQRWTCIEFRIDQSLGTVATWVDGVAPPGLQQDGVATPEVDEAWLTRLPGWRPHLNLLRLGWEAYGGATNTVWIDDVAIGNARIGCSR